ncbi:2,5-dichloro-2,5-cyclohexadiene-1,4-diol dehydrogenase [Nemania sp. FL0916]|nr:2,5-dichloro-2,5-cyclohexadiene-1,4-diol dehydrogenase [Nemania sp. FL0916]
MKRFTGKTAVVTGAASGMGREVAEQLAAEGANVIGLDLSFPTLLSELRTSISITSTTSGDKKEKESTDAIPITRIKHDVTVPEHWATLAEHLSAIGGVDILINAAGIMDYGVLHETETDKWQRTLAVDLDGVMLGMRAVIPLMLNKNNNNYKDNTTTTITTAAATTAAAISTTSNPPSHSAPTTHSHSDGSGSSGRGGVIINFSSVLSYKSLAGSPAYHAAKAAVSQLTRNAAVTYAAQNIRVNAILPGLIKTPMVTGQPGEINDYVVERTPMGRMGTAGEIAKCVLFMASEDAAYMTGAGVVVDGGYSAQ